MQERCESRNFLAQGNVYRVMVLLVLVMQMKPRSNRMSKKQYKESHVHVEHSW